MHPCKLLILYVLTECFFIFLIIWNSLFTLGYDAETTVPQTRALWKVRHFWSAFIFPSLSAAGTP